MKKLFATLALPALALAAHAGPMESLENFVRTAKTGHAEFTQVITAPPRDGQPSRTKSSNGTFEFQRPDRFRFEYHKPFEQTIVADGTTLWLFDKDLNQVSSRKQAKVLASTPAALIAASPDLDTLKRDFDLQAAAGQGRPAMGAGHAEDEGRPAPEHEGGLSRGPARGAGHPR